jgi:hypothetical protein
MDYCSPDSSFDATMMMFLTMEVSSIIQRLQIFYPEEFRTLGS